MRSSSPLYRGFHEGHYPRERGGNVAGAEGRRPKEQTTPFDINYTEGVKVGCKWFDAEGIEPLFSFGFGFSYTTYSCSELKTTSGRELKVSFSVTDTGTRAGAEVAQVYVSLPPSAGEAFKRPAAWEKIDLTPGETKAVTLTLEPRSLSIFNVDRGDWELIPGEYKVYVGGSSRSTPLTATASIAGAP